MHAQVYEYNFSYTRNSYQLSYDSQVMFFMPISNPVISLEFDNIGRTYISKNYNNIWNTNCAKYQIEQF